MAKFLLILEETPGTHSSASPTEIQRIMEKYQAWFQRVKSSGKLVASNKLKEEGGKVLSMQGGKVLVVDGPYSEAKEVVGGYAILSAESYGEAIDLIRDCPHLAFGRLMVRQIDPIGCSGE
jgi:hypothetical protein